MTIQIIGGGAVGMLLASLFQKQYGEVELVVRRPQQVKDIHNNGLVKYDLAGERQVVAVKGNDVLREQPKLVVVATKSHQLAAVYPQLAKLHVDVPILFVQNGLAHYDEALSLPQRTIIFGSAQFGAERKSDYEVIHRGIGVLKLAVARGEADWLSELGDETFPVEWLQDAELMLFEKALLNCFVNPLTAILQVKNGTLVQNEAARALLQSLYVEVVGAFPWMEARFPFDAVQQLCERTANNTSSMLADRLAGRLTEVDSIVGAVLQKAQAREVSMPVLQTLYQLLKAFEQQESGE